MEIIYRLFLLLKGINMSDLQLTRRKSKNKSHKFGILVLRFIVTFLCTLIGFAFVLAGYDVAILLDINRREFSALTSAYFIISMGIWVIIGLSTPFTSISRVFEELRGMSSVHIVIFFLRLPFSYFYTGFS